MILIDCPYCQGEGGEFCGHPNDPHPVYLGPCLSCHGEGVAELETFPVDLEDLVSLIPKDDAA